MIKDLICMNYRVAKDNAISELIDPANSRGASFGFCFESDCVPQPDCKLCMAASSTPLKIK
jgi:hypothetical protein